MDYMNDILARLQRGESVETIAAQLTKDINAANDRYQAEKAAAEAAAKAKREASVARERKVDAIKFLLGAVDEVSAAWDLDLETDEITDSDIDDLVTAIDEMAPILQKQKELMDAIKELRETPVGDRSMKTAPDLPAVGDPIEDFLNKFVR